MVPVHVLKSQPQSKVNVEETEAQRKRKGDVK